MHYLEVLLVVTSPNLQKPAETKFLVLEQDGKLVLPNQTVGINQTTLEAASELLLGVANLYAKIGARGWVELTPCPLADRVDRTGVQSESPNDRWVGVPYGCMIPEAIAPSQGVWLTFGELVSREWFGDHFEILQAVVRFI